MTTAQEPPAIEEMPFLPQIGPIPRERPSLVRDLAVRPDSGPTELASYARMRIEQQTSSLSHRF